MSSPKEFHIDAIYPEPLSRLRRGHGGISSIESPNSAAYRRAVKKQRNRGNGGRFRTQPVTFQEIKEVDEDNIVEQEPENLRGSMGTVVASAATKSESDLKASFQLFYQSIKAGNDDDPISPISPISIGHLDFSSPTKSTGATDLFEPSRQQPTVENDTSNSDKNKEKDNRSSPTISAHSQTSPIPISFNTRSRQSF